MSDSIEGLVERVLEAAIGIEPMNKGFAVLANSREFSLVLSYPFLLAFSAFEFASDRLNSGLSRLVVIQE